MTDFSDLQRAAFDEPLFHPADWPGAMLPQEFMRRVEKGWTVGLSVNK